MTFVVRMRRTILALSLLMPALAGTAHAQHELAPIAPRLDSMRMVLIRPTDERDIGMLYDEVMVVEGSEGRQLRRVYRTENALFGDHRDTVFSTVPELKPLSHRTVSGPALEDLQFRKDSIVGWVEAEGRPRALVRRVADSALYDGHTFDLLIRRAPLEDGFTLEVPVLLTSRDTVAKVSAIVTGSASVPVEGGRAAETWVVLLDFAGVRSTMWIEKESRRLAKQVIELQPGVDILMDRLPRVEGEVRERRRA